MSLVERLKALVQENIGLEDLILSIRTMSGYDQSLQADDPLDNEGRMANLDELLSVARQFTEAKSLKGI